MDPNSKFKSVLQEKVERDKHKAEKEKELRREYGIEDGHSVGIKTHKESVVVGLWSILKDIIRSVATIILLLLASIGLVAILHPETRNLIIQIGVETMIQIRTFIS